MIRQLTRGDVIANFMGHATNKVSFIAQSMKLSLIAYKKGHFGDKLMRQQ